MLYHFWGAMFGRASRFGSLRCVRRLRKTIRLDGWNDGARVRARAGHVGCGMSLVDERFQINMMCV